MTYAKIVSPQISMSSTPPTVSTLSNSKVDKLFDAFSKKLQGEQGSKVDIATL
jgi:hypothetical protein